MSLHRGIAGRGYMYTISTQQYPNEFTRKTIQADNGSHTNQVYFQHGPPLRESTIERYKGPTTQPMDNKPDVETKLCHTMGHHHPYHRERDYLSKYPVGFCGFNACGGEGHHNSRKCPKRLTGEFNKEEFSFELWAHKPHTKNPSYGLN